MRYQVIISKEAEKYIKKLSKPRVGMLQGGLYCKAKQERGYYNRKSQRKSRLYGQRAIELLVRKYSLIGPTRYFVKSSLVKACSEEYREAVCGKTARTV